jgi:SHAQKYF class myb-like DNA-binding protein
MNRRDSFKDKPEKLGFKAIPNKKKIFGLIREEPVVKEKTRPEPTRIIKKRRREGHFNTGRWLPEEHRRFIEALMKYGNEWKSVQRYVGTRSSTQARSHAQKFFVKIGKSKLSHLSLDFAANSLKGINQLASQLDDEQISNAIQTLNQLAYDKKGTKIRLNTDDDDFLYQDITLPTLNDFKR